MAIDTRTIAELKKDGFTHIDARCASCGRIVQMPFRLLLTRQQITKATKITELRRRYRCQNCGGSHAAVSPLAARRQRGLTNPKTVRRKRPCQAGGVAGARGHPMP